MNATFATILLVSPLTAQEPYHSYYEIYDSAFACSEVITDMAPDLYEANMMAQCIETNKPTSTSAPVPRPNNLMESYDD